MRSHLKVYFDFEEITKNLNDAEKGRLLLAMLRYAKDGTETDMIGNEVFLFPAMKAIIDRDVAVYETKVTNGSKGGRPEKKKPDETENNRTKPKETEKNLNEPKETGKKFEKPTVEQVRDYIREQGYHVDADKWHAYYTANGWKVGKNQMKDWKAAVRTWERSDSNAGYSGSGGKSASEVRSNKYEFLRKTGVQV